MGVARIGWSQVTNQVTFSPGASMVTDALNASRNLLSQIPDEVHAMVVREITAGMNSGETLAQIQRRLETLLSLTGHDRWENRARTIAITETTRAANAGSLAAAVAAEPFTGTLLKRWNDEDDPNVRLTHAAVDGRELPLRRPFIVGVSQLMHPGDPIGSPEEVINCRCDLSFRRET